MPDEVATAYRGARPVYGPDYIIPSPFDPRLISRVPAAVAEAAMKSGVARKRSPIWRLSPSSCRRGWTLPPVLFQMVTAAVRAKPKRVVFAEGEEESVIRAASCLPECRPRQALLVGRADMIRAGLKRMGLDEESLEIRVPHSAQDADALYRSALQAHRSGAAGFIAIAVRMVTNDRNIYAASMLVAGDADADGDRRTRNYASRAGRCAHGDRSAAWACARSACR